MYMNVLTMACSLVDRVCNPPELQRHTLKVQAHRGGHPHSEVKCFQETNHPLTMAFLAINNFVHMITYLVLVVGISGEL